MLLAGKDVIGLAQTGSGKTGAFALPILQASCPLFPPHLGNMAISFIYGFKSPFSYEPVMLGLAVARLAVFRDTFMAFPQPSPAVAVAVRQVADVLVMQGLLDKPQAFFALVLSPTRELAIQIADQITALGKDIGVKCATLVGGIDMMDQAIAIARRPHVLVGTPGRVVDHLSNTKVRLTSPACNCESPVLKS